MFRKTFQDIAVKNKQFWQKISRPDSKHGRLDDPRLAFLDNGPYSNDSAARHSEKFHGAARHGRNFPAEFFNGRPSRAEATERFRNGDPRMSFQGHRDFWEGGCDRFSSKGFPWNGAAAAENGDGAAGFHQSSKGNDSGVRMNREEIIKYYEKS